MTTEDNDIGVPRKEVDPTDTVADRLTDNTRFNIGPSRYFVKDADGNIAEDWAGVFERVGRNVALGDLIHMDGCPDTLPAEALHDGADAIDIPIEGEGESATIDCNESVLPYVDTDAVYDHLGAEYPEVHDELVDVAGDFETMMATQQFMPNSPTLMNAGTEIQQLSACFTASPGDAMVNGDQIERNSIMGASGDAAAIFKSGGGVGYAFHHLRPKGAYISSTGGVSSGPVSFMEVFDTVCATVEQGGKRRGAQMGIMHVQHPDIGRFVLAKRNEDRLTNFNISVGISDAFIDAVENDDMLQLLDPATEFGPDAEESFDVVAELAHLYDPQFEDAWNDEFDKPGLGLDNKIVETSFWRDYQEDMQDPEAFDQFRDRISLEIGEPLELPAQFIWQLLIDGAHNNGEPGFVYLDEINREHSFDVEKHPEHIIHATNPCAEQPLENYEACNLGHINLSLLVEHNAPMFEEFQARGLPDFEDFEGSMMSTFLHEALDMDRFELIAREGTHFLDNVVSMSRFPEEVPEIAEQVRGKRKLGLGLMGFHQLAIQLGIEYGKPASRTLAREIMRMIDAYSVEESRELADTRGVFEEYEDSKWAAPSEYPVWVAKHGHIFTDEREEGLRVRNHNTTTIAPTGTTSMIGDTTAGCEPIYQVGFLKNVGDDIQGDQMLVEFDNLFLRTLEYNDIDVEAVKEEARQQMLDNEFEGVSSLSDVPDEIGELFVTTGDLTVEDHIMVQAAFQEHVDSSISKTLNLPNDATIGEVSEAVMLALDLGIKGSTVYRDGSRMEQVKTTRLDNSLENELDDEELIEEVESRLEDEDFAVSIESLVDTQTDEEAEEEMVRAKLSAMEAMEGGDD